MEKERQKVVVLIVIVICAAPAITWLAWSNGIFTPKTNTIQTTADRMVLRANDLGSDWQGQELAADDAYLGLSSQTYWELERSSNQSPLLLNIHLDVFNSSVLCEGTFLDLSATFQNQTVANCMNVTLGDGGITYNWSSAHGGFPCVTFTTGNVLCKIDTISSHYPQDWWQGALYYFATYQLEEIQRNQ